MGHVQKRTYGNGKSPRYIARVKVGGREQQKAFDRAREAKAWITEREGLRPSGPRQDNTMLSKVVEDCVASATGSTKTNRQHLANNLGDLGYLKLADVRTEDIAAWLEVLGEGRPWAGGKKLGPRTQGTLTKYLSAVFNDSVARGQITRNPCIGARKRAKPNEAVEPHEVMTVDQVRGVIDAAEAPVGLMVRLSATVGGMRPGEVGGLRVRSIDLTRKVCHVTEQPDGLYSAWGWRALKSDASRRTVPIPDDLCALLAQYLADHSDYAPHEPLFRTAGGGQWTSAHLSGQWRKAATIAGVTGHSWKSLRHFHASRLIERGESVTVVQHRLGHASPTVTLTVYSHLWPTADDKTREAFEGLLG